ncbi:hypothetical protein FTV88_0617 [Heliorestis convoluta]|uniref:Uncharacterized protein n=1 Tax=Heliorestis convoluta TaxID=356322 RepID=A0A5Q2MZX9_9FIRM|nr:hypothetical protein FTV88_0617 [Heliorestis convoluta]
MQPWSIRMKEHQWMDRFKVPLQAEITWKLDAGDYTWYLLEVEEIEYNKAEVY